MESIQNMYGVNQTHHNPQEHIRYVDEENRENPGTAAQVISEQDELQLKPIMGYTQIFHLPYAKFDLYDSNFAQGGIS